MLLQLRQDKLSAHLMQIQYFKQLSFTPYSSFLFPHLHSCFFCLFADIYTEDSCKFHLLYMLRCFLGVNCYAFQLYFDEGFLDTDSLVFLWVLNILVGLADMQSLCWIFILYSLFMIVLHDFQVEGADKTAHLGMGNLQWSLLLTYFFSLQFLIYDYGCFFHIIFSLVSLEFLYKV